MKVQEVKKECLANVGLSIEFSNSEVDSIVSLVRDLNISLRKGHEDLIGKTALDPNDVTVTIDLKSLWRAFSLLNKISYSRAFTPSHLFDDADREFEEVIANINSGAFTE